MIVVLSEAVNKIFSSFTVIEALCPPPFWFVFLFYDKKKIKQISTFFLACVFVSLPLFGCFYWARESTGITECWELCSDRCNTLTLLAQAHTSFPTILLCYAKKHQSYNADTWHSSIFAPQKSARSLKMMKVVM